jgi:hypothetical protein
MIKADIQNLIDTEISILKETKAAEIPEEPAKPENNDNNGETTGQIMSM